ncbi:MAG TPA: right-handed parallel beta-helix repeat-containing protein, partial [Verrucomicrobiae bacterium]|nr:right-handed parallel beta-helix repeat-containing protein [Verrucomicrobiae bacterium]
ANPILKGSTFVTTSGYTLAPNQAATIFSLIDSGTSSTDSGTRNWREQISHVQISNSAVAVTVTVKASASAALNITGSAIGPVPGSAPNTSSTTRITWGGGNNGTTVAAGTTATSDTITYSLSNSVDQIVSIYTTARNVEYYSNNNTTLWSDSTASDQSQATNVSGDGFATGGNSVVGSIVGTIQTAFTYRNTLGSTPVAVWENGSLLLSKGSQSAVEAAAGSWFYDGTFLYLHASDGSNVATNGKTYSYVTASSPTFTMWDNGNGWLIIDSLDQSETYNTSTATLGGLYLTGSNSIVRNLSAHDMYRHPLTIYLNATNDTVTNVTAYHAYGTSPLAIYGSGTTGNLVQRSTFYNDTSLSSAYVPTGVWSVMIAHGGSHGNTVDSCLIYSTAPTNGGYGIMAGDSGTTVTFSHNQIYGTYAYAVNVGSGGGDGLGTGASMTLWDNLIDISQANNVGILLTGSTGSIVYNNTIFGPSNTHAAISQASTSTGALVKNNIFYTGAYASVDASSETGTAYDYNDYFSASGSPFSWGGTAYTFSGWQTNASQDAHSFSADPALTNASSLSTTGNYAVLANSPAVDAGVNLGSAYQMALTPSATWPSGVSLINQNSVGSGWEIGAYVYQLNGSTRLLLGCCD